MKTKRLHSTLGLLSLLISSAFSQGVWQAQNPNFPLPTSGYQIQAVNEDVAWTWGFVLDSSGMLTYADYSFSRTTDGGQTWENGTFPQGDIGIMSNICALNAQNAWIAYVDFVNGNKVLKTLDGGQTWSESPVGATVFVDFVHFFNNGIGVVVGDPDTAGFEIFYTTSGGDFWQKVNPATLPPPLPGEFANIDGFDTEGNRLWFFTNFGRVYYTATFGISWEVWNGPVEEFPWNIECMDDGDCLLWFNDFSDTVTFIPHFTLYRTSDNGSSWQNLSPADNSGTLISIESVPGTGTLISSYKPGFSTDPTLVETRISYDKGATWKTIDTVTRVWALDFKDAQTGYATQMQVAAAPILIEVYRYVGSPLVGLLEHMPLNASITVTPNPTADYLNIELKAPAPDDFLLLLNDASGRLHTQELFPKTDAIVRSLDLRGLPPGVYTLTVSSREGCLARQVVKE